MDKDISLDSIIEQQILREDHEDIILSDSDDLINLVLDLDKVVDANDEIGDEDYIDDTILDFVEGEK